MPLNLTRKTSLFHLHSLSTGTYRSFYLSLQKENGQSITTLAGKIKQNCLFDYIKPQRQNIIMTFTRPSYKRQQFSIGLQQATFCLQLPY